MSTCAQVGWVGEGVGGTGGVGEQTEEEERDTQTLLRVELISGLDLTTLRL